MIFSIFVYFIHLTLGQRVGIRPVPLSNANPRGRAARLVVLGDGGLSLVNPSETKLQLGSDP